MRRVTRVIVALALLVGVVTFRGVTPAGAHFCSSPLQVPVGRPVTFTVGVPAEDVPVSRVDIEIPEGFELHRGVEFASWKVEREGRILRYTGGTISLFQCAFFTIAGEAPTKTKLIVPFTTYGADGAVVREFRSQELNHVDAAQLVYAGVAAVEESEEPDSSRQMTLRIAGWALIALALIGAAVLMIRRDRAGRPA